MGDETPLDKLVFAVRQGQAIERGAFSSEAWRAIVEYPGEWEEVKLIPWEDERSAEQLRHATQWDVLPNNAGDQSAEPAAPQGADEFNQPSPTADNQARDDQDERASLPPAGTLARALAGTDWAWRSYSIDQAWPVLGNLPPGAPPLQSREEQRDQDFDSEPIIYLFNVIVACEWRPSPTYLTRLHWAFRRASDFLYDITNGLMAFGKVTFGGPEWLPGADIQILASNRFYPRSWVGGLLEPGKFQPIRLGRGVWSKRHRRTIPWDEPEGYRVIVHEWAHYALGLKDAYIHASRQPAAGGQVLVTPSFGMAFESVMDDLAGTSELIKRGPDQKGVSRLDGMRKNYPHPSAYSQSNTGPGALPLPLPIFDSKLELGKEELWLDLPQAYGMFDLDHAWAFVRTDTPDGQMLIPQGSEEHLDGRRGFRLVGAKHDAELFIAGRRKTAAGYQPGVWRGKVGGNQPWRDVTPPELPLIGVIARHLAPTASLDADYPDDRRHEASFSKQPPSQPELDIWLLGAPVVWRDFTLSTQPFASFGSPPAHKPGGNPQATFYQPAQPGQPAPLHRDPRRVEPLDGCVLVHWGENELEHMALAIYSEGGGPTSHNPGGTVTTAPLLSAGSADGNALVFFDPTVELTPEETGYTEAIRVITTTNFGSPTLLPDGFITSEGRRAEARSYAFGLSATDSLVERQHPTLVMFVDDACLHRDGRFAICRALPEGPPEPIDSQTFDAESYVAAALTSRTAPALFKITAQPVDFYRLYWISAAA